MCKKLYQVHDKISLEKWTFLTPWINRGICRMLATLSEGEDQQKSLQNADISGALRALLIY